MSKKRKAADGSPIDIPDEPPKDTTKPVRKSRPAKCGTGALNKGDGNACRVADYEMYVGRTHPETTEDDIIGLIKNNTATDDNDEGVKLNIVEVINEAKDKAGRIVSKSWRVSFSFSDKEIMLQETSWPAGWIFRQYFPPREPKKNSKKIPLYKSGVSHP